MLEGRRAQFIEELIFQGSTKASAEKEVNLAIDRLIYYAGWCDKYVQVLSSVNPVSSSHFNFSTYEATGVVGVLAGQKTALIDLVSIVAPVIAGGNTCVVLANEHMPLCAVTFAEVLNSSDVPGGVVNILTGKQAEMIPALTTHMDVNAIAYAGDNEETLSIIQKNAVENLKRVRAYDKDWMDGKSQDLYLISDFQEVKTTWHPIENIGGATSSY
jgi:acyl-CoA reductase-like NAD-dependent aldehyde dehydrogenase